MSSSLHIGDALNNFINKSKLKSGLHAVQIEDFWEEIMGKTIADYTDKIEIISQTLFIYTSVGALKQELTYQKPKIISRINEAFRDHIISDVIIK